MKTPICMDCGVDIPGFHHRGYSLEACETCSKTRWLHPWFERNPDGTYKKLPVGKCATCKDREAEEWFSRDGTDYNRGGRMRPWCKQCIKEYLIKMRDAYNKALEKYEISR